MNYKLNKNKSALFNDLKYVPSSRASAVTFTPVCSGVSIA